MSNTKTLLAALGRPAPDVDAQWQDYPSLGISAADIPELISLAQSITLRDETLDEQDAFVSLHAWRALAHVGGVELIPLFVDLLLEDPNCDWLYEDLPIMLAGFGAEAIPTIEQTLANLPKEPFIRAAVTDGLALLAGLEPESRDRCVDILAKALADDSFEDPAWNAMLISNLVEIKALEHKDLMEAKFAADLVDFSFIGDWEDVQISLGLLQQRLTPRPLGFWWRDSLPAARTIARSKAPKAIKAKRTQQKKARKAQHKKKK